MMETEVVNNAGSEPLPALPAGAWGGKASFANVSIRIYSVGGEYRLPALLMMNFDIRRDASVHLTADYFFLLQLIHLRHGERLLPLRCGFHLERCIKLTIFNILYVYVLFHRITTDCEAERV